ncbi:MAG: 3-phosphoshikimate 1-carboxyvinyltransferase [Deltaproteobacteria bacterium]|jgi:3-phosphoshikimate 1-carboxyvinyltransferase|nr:3-phosphoshikimate 1-carboxyvinyltransferase [Deltaproteobacteria bacterium]
MPFQGTFYPPGDKSVSHRLILMSLLAEGEMLIKGLSQCEDCASSLAAFRALGGQARPEPGGLMIQGLAGQWPAFDGLEIDCRNSGTTMRLLSGILAASPGRYILDGDEQLRRRPMERAAEPLRLMGARVSTQSGRPPLVIEGRSLTGIDYSPADASAQVKGAVLLAGLRAQGQTSVTEAAATRTHTETLINFFRGHAASDGRRVTVSPSVLKLPPVFDTPGDPSSAAYFLTAAAFIPGSRVTASGMLLSPGRTGFLRVLDRMGAKVTMTMTSDSPEPCGEVTVEYDQPLRAAEVPAEEVPSVIDEIPMLALAATQAEGLTVYRHVDELRIKETDRLMSIRHQLGALGARVNIEGNDLFVQGPTSFIIPKELDSGRDHRLAMMLTMALKAAQASIPILGAESIAVSYPNFQEHVNLLWQK